MSTRAAQVPAARIWRDACSGAPDTRALGAGIAALLAPGDLVVLSGRLGAGKTTLVQGIAQGLGITAPVTSPTFVLARELAGGRLPLVHVDAYRLGSALELEDLDLESDLAEAVVAVEWGEGLVERLSADRLEIALERGEDDTRRTVEVRAVGPRWAGVDLTSLGDRMAPDGGLG